MLYSISQVAFDVIVGMNSLVSAFAFCQFTVFVLYEPSCVYISKTDKINVEYVGREYIKRKV